MSMNQHSFRRVSLCEHESIQLQSSVYKNVLSDRMHLFASHASFVQVLESDKE